ncbi:hypothetical protein NRB20_51050 [Nocardia sp. RB20]|uniref:Uncharacterized protein n=1 Tax=Nocardia macrotermitis TaxID=2585198 RepID=A0A7K0D9J4_9NOCA|nr:hypothetical protein [Nocardia macrotermitis]
MGARWGKEAGAAAPTLSAVDLLEAHSGDSSRDHASGHRNYWRGGVLPRKLAKPSLKRSRLAIGTALFGGSMVA